MAGDLLLAIETSGSAGSIALAEGEQPVVERDIGIGPRRTGDLVPALGELLRERGCRPAEVRTFCFSAGPGSFTGLRIGATLARMMHSAVGCDVVAVPTLEVVAANALSRPTSPPRIAVMLDAGGSRVYGAAFERVAADRLQTDEPAGVYEAAAWLAKLRERWPPACGSFAVLGEGVRVHRAACEASGAVVLEEPSWTPRAACVAALGRRMAAAGRICRPEQIVPLYLRPPECEEVYERRRAAARAKRGE